MARRAIPVCDSWDLTTPAGPSRSPLYPLAPLGVGTPVVESLTSATGGDVRSAWEMWVAHAVGQLLSAAPTLPAVPTRRRVAATLDQCVPALAPSFNALARATGMQPQTLSNWRHETHAAMLGHLCRFCYAIGLSPLAFLTHEPGTPFPGRLVSAGEMAALPRVTPPHPHLDAEALRHALEAALVADPPRSLSQVARDLGHAPSLIRTRFPNAHQAICARYAHSLAERHQQRAQARVAAIQQVVGDLVRRDIWEIYSSHGRVGRLLPFSLRAPELADAWRDAVKELAWANKTGQDPM